jgi:hypothetical protein
LVLVWVNVGAFGGKAEAALRSGGDPFKLKEQEVVARRVLGDLLKRIAKEEADHPKHGAEAEKVDVYLPLPAATTMGMSVSFEVAAGPRG